MIFFLPLLFLFGIAIGSFLNVVALRYDPDTFLFSKKRIGGRSHCPHCGKTLRWFELIPIASFVLQRASCRNCGAPISYQYPIVEILSGLIFVFVPFRIGFISPSLLATPYLPLSALWVLVFESLLLMSLIDIRLQIIPDEINIFLLLLGLCAVGLRSFGVQEFQSLLGFLFALIFFGLIILVTRGRGMGLGDLKLAAPLGLLLGWANILVLTLASFIVGAVFGVYVLAFKGKTMKSAVPFGPFLAIGAAIAFFAGPEIVHFYLSMLA